MPIITVSHKGIGPPELLDKLRIELPDIVSKALDCDEEPYDGRLKPGDVNMKFLPVLHRSEALDYLIEIRTKRTKARSENLQERSDAVKSTLEELGLSKFGVWIETLPAAWSQD